MSGWPLLSATETRLLCRQSESSLHPLPGQKAEACLRLTSAGTADPLCSDAQTMDVAPSFKHSARAPCFKGLHWMGLQQLAQAPTPADRDRDSAAVGNGAVSAHANSTVPRSRNRISLHLHATCHDAQRHPSLRNVGERCPIPHHGHYYENDKRSVLW
jgi:hypothetical protein